MVAQAAMELQELLIPATQENIQADLALSDKVIQAVTDITAVVQDIQILVVKDRGATHAGGAGGGAGGRGISRFSNWNVVVGGRGMTSAIDGTARIYAAGGGGGTHVNPYYGHGPNNGGAADGTGNSGTHGGAVATAGGTNRGGGGGGGAHPGGENPAGAGGPGVVVVRYRV